VCEERITPHIHIYLYEAVDVTDETAPELLVTRGSLL